MPDRRRAIEREHLRAALVPRDEPLKLSLARAIASWDISNRVWLPVERRGLLPRLRLLGAEEACDPEPLADGGLRALADERAAVLGWDELFEEDESGTSAGIGWGVAL